MDAVVRPVKPCGKFSLVGEAIITIVIDHPHHGRHNYDLDCWTRHHCQPFHHDLFKPTMIKITIVVINLQTENHDHHGDNLRNPAAVSYTHLTLPTTPYV